METWWDGSYDWSVAMEGYRLFWKDRLGRWGGVICMGEQKECMELCLEVDEEPDENLWVKIKGTDWKSDVIVGVCYRPLDQEEQADEALCGQIEAPLQSQAHVLMVEFNHCNICWRVSTAGHK